jgi:hypothetical protein
MNIKGCNCWQWSGPTGGKEPFYQLPCSTAVCVAIGHPICIVNVPHVTVIIRHNCCFYRIPVFVAIIAFSGWIVNVCQEAYVSPRFSLSVWGLRSLGMFFLCGLTVPQIKMFFWAKSSYRSGEEKKLSIYSLCPNPSTPFVRLVTVLCVAVRCCSALCLYQGKHSCHIYIL